MWRKPRKGSRRTTSWKTRLWAQLCTTLASWNRGIAQWLALVIHDFVHPNRSRRYATRMAWGVALLMFSVWMLLSFTSEKFLPATLLAYGPRAAVLIPVIVVLPWVLISARRAIIPLLIATWIAVVPVMGARFAPIALMRSFPESPESGTVRVMTFNVLIGNLLSLQLTDLIDTYHPQIIGFQECGEQLRTAIQELDGWYTDQVSGLCTLSRWPLTPLDSMNSPKDSGRERGLLGGYGNLARYRIDTPNGPFVFVNLHLPTARYGLESLVAGDGLVPSTTTDAVKEAARVISATAVQEIDERLTSSRRARELASERASLYATSGEVNTPLIVVGDFNMPVESTIYRQYWSHLSNTFERVGNGLGWSKVEGKLLRIRIDHILTNGSLMTPLKVVIGDSWYSDHRPVVADFRLRANRIPRTEQLPHEDPADSSQH